MNIAERALDALLRAPVLSERRLAAVWLFGSHARGEADIESDVDLAVLCLPSLGNDRFALMELVARTAGVEIDVIDLETANPILAWEVLTTGRIVVERDEEHVEHFVRHARFAAEDATRRNRMVVLASVDGPGDHLSQVLVALRRLRAMPRDQRDADALHQLAAERALHVAAEAIFDIGHHVLAGRGLPIPSTYREVLPALVRAGVLDASVEARLVGLAGLRNILVHDYGDVDPARLWELVDGRLEDLEAAQSAFAALRELTSPPA